MGEHNASSHLQGARRKKSPGLFVTFSLLFLSYFAKAPEFAIHLPSVISMHVEASELAS